jgi:outer membrane biosynthesis protein TonB
MKDCLKWSAAVVALLMAVAAANAQETPQSTTAPPTAAVSAQSEKNNDATADGDSIVYQVGGSVQPPIAIHTPDPKFSKEASKAKFSGNVVVSLIVDKDGKPRDVHVLRGMGHGPGREGSRGRAAV